jgi:predicted permease
MELAIITVKQVLELFVLIISGIFLYKKNIIREDGKKLLSDILIKFVVPCMIINSYMGKFNDEVLDNIGKSFIYSIILCVIGIVISLAVSFVVSDEHKGIFRFACSFSNAAYMGFPLIRALFGEEGILYASSYVTVFNILLWSVGYVFFADKMPIKKLLKNLITCPPIIAVVVGLIIYLFKIPVTNIIADPISSVGAMTTPISMIVTGVAMGEAGIVRLIKQKHLLYGLFIRLILIPMVSLLVFYIFNISGIVATVTLVLEACPCAAITTMFAIQYGHDQKYAAALVVISTICSIVTLPLYVYLIGMI